MAIFDESTLTEHLRSRDLIEWVSSRAADQQLHPIQDLYERRLEFTELLATEIYHGLIWFFEAYPQVQSIKPMWEPIIDEDRNILVRVRLDIHTSVEADQQDVSHRQAMSRQSMEPMEAYYSYGDPPPSIESGDPAAFNTLVELCEGVGPETWNEFHPYEMACVDRKPYRSAAEVEADMDKDLRHFLAPLHEWLLERKVSLPESSARKPSPRM